MIILGLDAAAKTAGVALLCHEAAGDRLLYESYLATGYTHSETLLPLVDAALRACRLRAADIELYALTAGPGSFTGLRIGMALIKGLAAARSTPCVPVSTLQALAAGCDTSGLLLPAMDARRGEVYAAAFWRDQAGLHRLLDDAALPAAEAAAAALRAARDWLGAVDPADMAKTSAQNAAATSAQTPGETLGEMPGVQPGGTPGVPPGVPLSAAPHTAPAQTPAAFPVTVLGDGGALCAAAWPPQAPPPHLVHPDRRLRTAAAAARLGAAADAGQTLPADALRPDYHRLCQAERERLAAQGQK